MPPAYDAAERSKWTSIYRHIPDKKRVYAVMCMGKICKCITYFLHQSFVGERWS